MQIPVHAEAGGLASYSPDMLGQFHRAAAYVSDKILKGTKPADLPIEQATKFELVINMNTAKTLGLTIPLPLLGRADKVMDQACLTATDVPPTVCPQLAQAVPSPGSITRRHDAAPVAMMDPRWTFAMATTRRASGTDNSPIT